MENKTRLNSILQGLLVAAVFAAAFPVGAFAQDLANSVTHLTGTELTNIPDLINAVFYIGGATYVGAGLLKVKQHADNPTQTKLGEAVGRLSTGAAMMSLPYVASVAVQTFAFGSTPPPYTGFASVQ